MPREGPCAAPQCPTPDESGGQWQYIPTDFATQNGCEGRCVCKKADCLRWCGLKEPKKTPGRKRAAVRSASPESVMSGGDELPRPPYVVSINEIWGTRCVHDLHLPHVAPHPALALTLLLLHRFIDLNDMDSVDRANALTTSRSSHIEYLVHGKYKRNEADLNGVFGAWYVPLSELVASLDVKVVEDKVTAFEVVLREARETAIAAAGTAADEDED